MKTPMTHHITFVTSATSTQFPAGSLSNTDSSPGPSPFCRKYSTYISSSFSTTAGRLRMLIPTGRMSSRSRGRSIVLKISRKFSAR